MFVHVGVADTCAYLCAIRYKPFLLSLQNSQLQNLTVKIQLIIFLDKDTLILAQIYYVTHYDEKNYNYLFIDPLMRLQVDPTVNRRRTSRIQYRVVTIRKTQREKRICRSVYSTQKTRMEGFR